MLDWIPNSLEHPERLFWLLLIPLFIALYVLAQRRRGRQGMRFTNTSMLSKVVRSQSQWRRHLAVGLSMLSLAALTIAFTQPMNEARVPRERATVVVVIDVSQSMAATDVDPTRLDAAKESAQAFVEQMPPEYNVALVSMSGSSSIRLPPTTDRTAALQQIDALALEDGTAMGEAIALSLEAIAMAPEDPNDPENVAPGTIVLLGDGVSNIGRPAVQGAQAARDAEVPIHTIAYGTQTGFVELDGQRYKAAVDEDQMREVAEITEGEMHTAASAGKLDSVYQDIGSEIGYELEETEVTAQYAGWSFGFGLLATLAAVSLAVRWP